MSKYQVQTRLSTPKLKKLVKGSSVKITPADHSNGSNHTIVIHFNKLKDANRIYRNLSKNKGAIIKPSQFEDVEFEEQVGSGLFSSMKSMAMPMAKQLAKQVAPTLAKTAIQNMTGNAQMANMAGQLTNTAMGNGIFGIKNIKQMAMPMATQLAKQVAPTVAKAAVQKLSGNSEMANMAGELTKTAVGKGFFKDVKNFGKKAVNVGKQVASNPIVQAAAEMAKPMVKNAIQQSVAPAVMSMSGNPALGLMAGQMAGQMMGSGTNFNLPMAHTIAPNHNDRMAYVRSHRGKGFTTSWK